MTFAQDDAVQQFLEILALKRAADSEGELKLLLDYVIPAIAQYQSATRDDFGNHMVRIGTSPVMWSCHTDTVHYSKQGVGDQLRQKLHISDEGMLSAVHSSCLGADNGVGVFIMLQMIKAGKEGLYIFHREEETGGKGSRYISGMTPKVVEGIKYAIAFDRKGTGSVITHQGTRCCSDAFADSLIAGLGMAHAKDQGGVFTDTANYTHLIPECTNISAGFYNEHTFRESCDLNYVMELLQAVLKLDVDSLVVSRNTDDPVDYGWQDDWWMHGGYKTYRETRRYDTDDPQYVRQRILDDPELCYLILRQWGIAEHVVGDMDAYP